MFLWVLTLKGDTPEETLSPLEQHFSRSKDPLQGLISNSQRPLEWSLETGVGSPWRRVQLLVLGQASCRNLLLTSSPGDNKA